jgi:hypothetical protein
MLHSNNASLKQQRFTQTTTFKQQRFAQTKQRFTYIKSVSSFKKYTKHSNNTSLSNNPSLKQRFAQTDLVGQT